MFRTFHGIAFAVLSLAVAPLAAHPGHGRDGGSHEVAHYATEPDHVLPVAAAVLTGIAVAGGLAWARRKV